MTKVTLEVGKSYVNGYGHITQILSDIQITEDRTVFYDLNGRGYESDGRCGYVLHDADNPLHLREEVAIIHRQVYDDLVYNNPKRLRRITAFTLTISVISILMCLLTIYLINGPCGL